MKLGQVEYLIEELMHEAQDPWPGVIYRDSISVSKIIIALGSINTNIDL